MVGRPRRHLATFRSASSPSSSRTTASSSSAGAHSGGRSPAARAVYVERLLEQFGGAVRTSAPVQAIERLDAGVRVVSAGGDAELFDQVVIATHSDQALAMLDRPTPAEREVLGAMRYQANEAVLHTDAVADANAPPRLGELELPPQRPAAERGPRSPTG